jgi:hypothetical protein
MELDKAALDRWITREPDWEEDDADFVVCDSCGKTQCDCDRLQTEDEAEAQRLIY